MSAILTSSATASATTFARHSKEALISAEVRNAVIALSAAKMASDAATNSRKLQEQLFSAEMERFKAGFSTNFNVIQQQAYLAQSQTTEVVAQAAWQKALVQLDRALGETLQRHRITLNEDTKAR